MSRFIPPRNLTGAVYQAFVSLSKYLSGMATVPVGAITAYGGTVAPDDWLVCNGAAVSRTTYPDLFAAIGTAFGAGDGSTTFNLPDMRDRFPVGSGGSYTLGTAGGSKDATVVSHTHNVGSYTSSNEAAGYGLTPSGTFTDRVKVTASPGDGTSSTGSSGTNANLPPYRAVNYIIRAS